MNLMVGLELRQLIYVQRAGNEIHFFSSGSRWDPYRDSPIALEVDAFYD